MTITLPKKFFVRELLQRLSLPDNRIIHGLKHSKIHNLYRSLYLIMSPISIDTAKL